MYRTVQVAARRSSVLGCAVPLCLGVFDGLSVALAGEPLQAQLRLLTHNVYGKHEFYCEQRGTGFGNIVASAVPTYDIVGVTEYYSVTDFDWQTCDSDPLLDAIRCTGRYTASANSRLFYPEAELLPLDEFDGGQGLFTTGTICDFGEWEWSYQQAGALQGVILSRVKVPNTTVTLDVYVVHIHSEDADNCDPSCRADELQHLADIIIQRSARSGNPVIVMGDFNIGGPPSCCGPQGYGLIQSALGAPRDLWLEQNACGRTTCGFCDFEECGNAPAPEELVCQANPTCGSVFCAHVNPNPNDCNPGSPPWHGWAGYTWDGCLNNVIMGTDLERIDYIFVLEDAGFSSSAFEIVLNDATIADFTAVIDPPPTCFPCFYPNCFGCPVDDPSPFVSNVSDHLGVEAIISIHGRSAVWVDHLAAEPESGTSCNPYSTVTEGMAAVPSGDRVLIRSGGYAETMLINRGMTLQALGGVVRIGY